MAERLIITNGDAAAERMREAAIAAEILPWRDMLHDGPVPGGLSLAQLSQRRADYLARAGGLAPDPVRRGFAARDAVINDHRHFGRVELWFEHDLFDQLQLIQILDLLASLGRTDEVFLVQASDYLGPMSAEAIGALDGIAQPATRDQFAAGSAAWRAFTAATPERLPDIAASEASPLPYLPAALRRLLEELPAVGSGLALTEERALAALAEEPRRVGELFAVTQAQEEARFLGDTPFFGRLDGLAFCQTPLIEGLPFHAQRCAKGAAHPDYRAFAASTVTLTGAGRAALAEEFDHAANNGVDRWLGGTHLTRVNLWRRDRNGTLVAPMLH